MSRRGPSTSLHATGSAGGGGGGAPSLIAQIDPTPIVPHWHQIEHDVDDYVMIALSDQANPTASEVADAWKHTLAARYPAVSLLLDEHIDGQRMRRYGALALHALFFTRDPRLQLDLLLDEWYQLGPNDTAYSVQRMRSTDIEPLLAQVGVKRAEMEASGMMDAFNRAVLERFERDLAAHAQRLAQRQVEVYPPLPAPESVPAPAPVSNRQYLAPTLARARKMVDALKQSLGMQ